MTAEGSGHREQWQPPPRPEWVQRINDEGRCMDISGVVPLDTRSLIDAAQRATGLVDFGADDWREAFHVLCKSLEEDAELNLMGRIRTRSELLLSLQARLQVEDCYRRHPEIDDEQIVQPIIVVGQGRSGTSLLVKLLAADPDNCPLSYWEAYLPWPPPERATYRSDPRIARGHRLIDQWNRVTPTLATMHVFAGHLPQEDCHLLAMNFMSSTWFNALGQVASYDAWLARQDMTPALLYHRRVLKLLQWKNPRKHWIIKDPTHLDRLALLVRIYPDARFVWPHRDPVRALASMVSLCGTLQWGRSDVIFKGGSYDYLTDPYMAAGRLDAVIAQLQGGLVPEGQFHNLLYRDLVREPMETMATMYRKLGLSMSEAGRHGIAEFIAANPRDARPPHAFNAGTPEAIARTRDAFRRYQQHFGIPDE